MAKLLRSMLAIAGFGAMAVCAGFFVFVAKVGSLTPKPTARTDAIVVLTGDEDRISTGMQLMMEGQAKRLLVSGVHRTTRVPTELRRYAKGRDKAARQLFRCCVDIGHDALNTRGNAEEARRWVVSHRFKSLTVVTSSYHMPRSLAEFRRAMPNIELVSYPVIASRPPRLENWWAHAPTARLLAAEYLKLLGASARLALARLMTPVERLPARPKPADGTPSAAVLDRHAER